MSEWTDVEALEADLARKLETCGKLNLNVTNGRALREFLMWCR